MHSTMQTAIPRRLRRPHSRRLAPTGNAILLTLLISSGALLILSFVPLILLWKVDTSIAPDVRLHGQPRPAAFFAATTNRFLTINTSTSKATTEVGYQCTETVDPHPHVVPRDARNNIGYIYDLRHVAKLITSDGDRINRMDSASLAIQFTRVTPTTNTWTSSDIHVTMDVLQSDWNGVFNLTLPLHTLLQNDDVVVVSIPWQMDLYGTSSSPLWVAIYGTKEAGYRVSIQLAYQRHVSLLAEASACISDTVRALEDGHTIVIGEAYFLEPRRVPYYRLASTLFTSPKVTLCTQLTIDRLPRLDAMAQNWKGPVSAVLYLGYRGKVHDEMAKLDEYWDKSVALQEFVDLHLVIDDKKPWFKWEHMKLDPYPVNLLRQLSVDYANRTAYILYVEGDMVPIPRGHDTIASTWDALLEADNANIIEFGQPAAFAVPLYYLEDCPEEDPDCISMSDTHSIANDLANRVPRSKGDLVRSIVHDKKQYGVKKRFYLNQYPFDFEGWEEADGRNISTLLLPYDGKDSSLKYVPPYLRRGKSSVYERKMQMHEPYVIVRKDGLPPYDVLYWGMKGDKRTQIYDMLMVGYRFMIHRDVFLINYSDDHTSVPQDEHEQQEGTKNGKKKKRKRAHGWDWISPNYASWRDFVTFVHFVMTGHNGLS